MLLIENIDIHDYSGHVSPELYFNTISPVINRITADYLTIKITIMSQYLILHEKTTIYA